MDTRLQAEIDMAVAHLIEHKQVDRDQVNVANAESVTWSDGSLGCPQPGMMYTQALVPGYRITLEADGHAYQYHGRRGGPPEYCKHPKAPAAAHPDS